ncbi:MAG: hypothetical protein L6290_10080 [Thermodesulfovibrionales bacterium]|nr:hypothetical protein [Thermodesulfovibrionales bacterium]
MRKKIVMLISLCLCMSCAAAVQETSPGTKGKVAVCHKGKKTLHVDESAVKAHLGHGDYLGPCR